jgi:hypothetical protein
MFFSRRRILLLACCTRGQTSLQNQFHGAIDGHAHDSILPVYPAVGVEKILLGLPVAPQIHARIWLNAGRRRQGPWAGKGRGNERAGILGFLKVIEEPDQ